MFPAEPSRPPHHRPTRRTILSILSFVLLIASIGVVYWSLSRPPIHERLSPTRGMRVRGSEIPIPYIGLSISAALLILSAILALIVRRKVAFSATVSLILLCLLSWGWTKTATRFLELTFSYQRERRPGRVFHELRVLSGSGGLSFERMTAAFKINETNPIAPHFELALYDIQWYPFHDCYPAGYALRVYEDKPVYAFPYAIKLFAAFSKNRSVILAPYWCWMLPCTILPTIWLLRRALPWYIRRRRLRQSRCLHCGYDLRATPTLCPECGTPVPASMDTSRGTL